MLAYQNNIIIRSDSSNSVLNDDFTEATLEYTVKQQENVEINHVDDHFIIESKNDGRILLKLDEVITNEVLLIHFKMNDIPSCKNGDTSITINGIMNKLTCGSWKYYNGNETFDYVLSSNESIDELEIEISKGSYDISDIKIYKIDKTFFDDIDITPLLIVSNTSKNSILEGTINQEEDGYFIFTIPYDEGFKAFVDDVEVNIEKVNDSFIGFPITEGEHSIRLEFEAPYFDLGKGITLVTGFIFIGVLIYEKKHFE